MIYPRKMRGNFKGGIMKWTVKYQDLRLLKARMPFFNLQEIVDANSRLEAIAKVKSQWHDFGHYGNYHASKLT